MSRGFERISIEQQLEDLGNVMDIKLPKRATAKSAGYDFYVPYSFSLKPSEEIKLPTGIKAYMQEDEILKIHPRSSLGFSYYARLANSCGIIDADYYDNENNEGHIWIKLRNESEDKFLEIERGEAIAQGIFHKYLIVDDDDFEGEERKGGIGSTN